MRIEVLRLEVKKKLKELRSIARLLEKEIAEEYFNSLTEEQQIAFCKFTARDIRKALRKHENKILEEKTMRSLRALASRHGIKNYSTLTRDELVLHLRSKVNA